MTDQDNTVSQKPAIGSAFGLLSKSWDLVGKNMKLFFLIFLPYVIISIPNSFPVNKKDYGAKEADPNPFKDVEAGEIVVMALVIIAVALAVMLIVTFFMSAYYKASVVISSGKQITAGEAYSFAKKTTLRQFGLGLISGIIIILGFILLIIPGIIALARLTMAPFLLADKDLSIKEALSQSNEMGKKHFGYVWGAIGVYILVSLLVSAPAIIPIIGGILSALLLIPFSLVVPLRYVQLRDLKA